MWNLIKRLGKGDDDDVHLVFPCHMSGNSLYSGDEQSFRGFLDSESMLFVCENLVFVKESNGDYDGILPITGYFTGVKRKFVLSG